MRRRTKIVATLGPATDGAGTLEQMILAGVDVVRVNMSHGSHDEHRARVRQVREISERIGRQVAVLVDLQGPKIRIERFESGKVELHDDEPFILDADCPVNGGTSERVGLTYKELVSDVSSGDVLLLDDGCIVLRVERVEGNEIHTRVAVGGELSNNKGINRQGGGLSAGAITDKDREDVKLAAEVECDYLAISFPRDAADVEEARHLLREAGGDGALMAKIERAEAVEDAEAIVRACDAIMVARGDLGVELGDEKLPGVQKKLISLARSLDRVVITATQMMQSMVESPIPTRAEVFDVANAVLDGTDAVMLSAETAAGNYPIKVVAAMDRICRGAERQREAKVSGHRMEVTFERIDTAIAMATMYTANHLGVTAIAALTESGSTPLWMSRISSGIPIYALSPHVEARRRMALYRGVYAVNFHLEVKAHRVAVAQAVDELKRRGVVQDGDMVIITLGDLMGVHGGTNAMKIVRVGDESSFQDT